MKIEAWIQMGCERREVTFDVTDEEIERVGEDGLGMYIEDAVLDWIECRYGWGWSCDLMNNDCSINEDSAYPSLAVTMDVLNPRTERLLVQSRAG